MLVAQLCGVHAQVLSQHLAIARSTRCPRRMTEGEQRRQAEVRVDHGESDDLHIRHRVVGAENLDAQLVMLTEPPT